jgi:hypothetical protein
VSSIPMTVHYIDFNRLKVYEAGALLLTLLAYPGESKHDDELRSRVHASLCACSLRALYETDPDWATRSQLVKPIYLLQTQHDCNQALRQLKRRLRDRMVAARMAYPFLKEAESGEAPKLPAAINRLSINALSELVLDDAGYTDPENVETRIWRPSRPVIHLASAVHGYLHLDPKIEALGLGPLFTHRQVIEYVIRNAEYCEPLVISSKHLRVDADRLVKLRLR